MFKWIQELFFAGVLVVLFVVLSGCKPDKAYEPIVYSKDTCHYCKMVISDKRFGAEIVTKNGKVYKFDSIECLGHHLEEKDHAQGEAFVSDSFRPGEMLKFKEASFFHDQAVRSPMGKGIFVGESQSASQAAKDKGAQLLTWKETLKLIGMSEVESRF